MPWPERQDRGTLTWTTPSQVLDIEPDGILAYYETLESAEMGETSIAFEDVVLEAGRQSRGTKLSG